MLKSTNNKFLIKLEWLITVEFHFKQITTFERYNQIHAIENWKPTIAGHNSDSRYPIRCIFSRTIHIFKLNLTLEDRQCKDNVVIIYHRNSQKPNRHILT